MHVDFWFDPGCPWCWITSRWMTEVRPHRGLQVSFRTFSLYEKNRDGLTEEMAEVASRWHRALRVVEAGRVEGGEQLVDALYTEFGARIHHDGDTKLDNLTDAVVSAGAHEELASAADHESWDKAIQSSMDEALEAAGNDVGTPTIRFGGQGAAFFGPVISPAPTGQAALDLYDGLIQVHEAGAGGFYELKRGRDVGPIYPERP